MTSKKDDAIKSILSDFEEFANLVLHQLDLLEKIVNNGGVAIADEIVNEMQELQTLLAPHEIDVFSAFTHTIRGQSVIHGLIRVLRLDDTLSQTLARLPQHIVVKIDPESLL